MKRNRDSWQIVGLSQPARAGLIAVRSPAAGSFVEALISYTGAGFVNTAAGMGEPKVHVLLQTETPVR